MKYYELMRLCFPLAAEAAALSALAVAEHVLIANDEQASRRHHIRARRRTRRTVPEIFDCLGPTYFRRAYRMDYQTFWILHDKLHNHMENYLYLYRRRSMPEGGVGAGGRKGGNYSLPPIPNGRISMSVRLACAIRYFAGGCPYNLMVVFGISYVEVMTSVWTVVETVNKFKEFDIEYPREHTKQEEIARKFQAVSGVGFDNCAGAVDGVLIWISKPTLKDSKKAGTDRQKLFCARKNKFGLNMQAVSDVRGRILDFSINYGGASSDCIAFESGDLYKKLERGILRDGLVLFGDNAYLNTEYMATPFPNVSRGAEDIYNFYHSQLRIRVECCFGQFVHRWGILRSALPYNITIPRIVGLVGCLARLHNFCIDAQGTNSKAADEMDPADRYRMIAGGHGAGYVSMEQVEMADVPVPTDLILGDGMHDITENVRRRQRQLERANVATLPRSRLLLHVMNTNMDRPTRRGNN